jgi:hypothetical protein
MSASLRIFRLPSRAIVSHKPIFTTRTFSTAFTYRMASENPKKVPGQVHEITSLAEFKELVTNSKDKGPIIIDAFAEW